MPETSVQVPTPPKGQGSCAILHRPPEKHYAAIVLSDLHFPRRDSHPKYLLEFLRVHSCDTLVLLGDTHEGYDPALAPLRELHLRVMDLIAARREQGMAVIDVPGNHDDYKRQDGILGHRIFGTEYWPDLVMDSNLGKTYLFHGDALDAGPNANKDYYIYKAASKIKIAGRSLVDLYSAAISIKTILTGGADAKTNCKKIESAAADLAASRGCSAVLMGHTHYPSEFQRVLDRPEIAYGNTGCWTGGQSTAMVLHHDGRWEMIDWRKERERFGGDKPAGLDLPSPHSSRREESELAHAFHTAVHAAHMQAKAVDGASLLLEAGAKKTNRIRDFQNAALDKLESTRQTVNELARAGAAMPLDRPSGAATALVL